MKKPFFQSLFPYLTEEAAAVLMLLVGKGMDQDLAFSFMEVIGGDLIYDIPSHPEEDACHHQHRLVLT